MSTPYLSEIRLVSFYFPPKGWALCNGQILPINQNQALFSLLGTTYGGDGRVNFALPNLQGRVPLAVGNGHTLGEVAGAASVTLNVTQIPAHVHALSVSTAAGAVSSPVGAFPAASPINPYYSGAGSFALGSGPSGSTGSTQAHNNMSPYLVLNYVIALQGIYPSQN